MDRNLKFALVPFATNFGAKIRTHKFEGFLFFMPKESKSFWPCFQDFDDTFAQY